LLAANRPDGYHRAVFYRVTDGGPKEGLRFYRVLHERDLRGRDHDGAPPED